MQTKNLANENFNKLVELFPNAFTEYIDENGKLKRTIDKDILEQEINTQIISEKEERYQFTWPEKNKAVLLANSPINATLRPCKEESIGKNGEAGKWDSENLYIEGDNLDVLKLLQETYLGKVKMIYIDPPYNTGGDFIYKDDFVSSECEYLGMSGQYDEDGNMLVENKETSGRFHTDWLNMIYPRLKLAKNLLSEDGAIFISIDDHEVSNLIKVCNEIFGENLVETNIWSLVDKAETTFEKTAGYTTRKEHEYIIMCRKNADTQLSKYKNRIEFNENSFSNPDNDERGEWFSGNISRTNIKTTTGSKYYTIKTPTGIEYTRNWTLSKEEYKEALKDNRIYFSKNGDGVPRYKIFKTDSKETIQSSIFSGLKTSISGKNLLEEIFNFLPFEYPKPIELIMRFLEIASTKNSIILDFFSGSATTAHAVMKLNAEDGGKRRFIMVQLPEPCDKTSESFKAGYKNICEIGKERIRRIGAKIKEENPLITEDLGFRVLKLDSSNMKDVYYNPDEMSQGSLSSFIDNIKEDRTSEDLLFQVMLELGILLSSEIKELNIKGYKIYKVENLIACFDEKLSNDVVIEIAKMQPEYFVMRDSSIENDSMATNFQQIFLTYSPQTKRMVL